MQLSENQHLLDRRKVLLSYMEHILHHQEMESTHNCQNILQSIRLARSKLLPPQWRPSVPQNSRSTKHHLQHKCRYMVLEY